jgi:hypothetical protein
MNNDNTPKLSTTFKRHVDFQCDGKNADGTICSIKSPFPQCMAHAPPRDGTERWNIERLRERDKKYLFVTYVTVAAGDEKAAEAALEKIRNEEHEKQRRQGLRLQTYRKVLAK